jgi:hypothetical protein
VDVNVDPALVNDVKEIVREIVADVVDKEQKQMKILFLLLLRALQRYRNKLLILFLTLSLQCS